MTVGCDEKFGCAGHGGNFDLNTTSDSDESESEYNLFAFLFLFVVSLSEFKSLVLSAIRAFFLAIS